MNFPNTHYLNQTRRGRALISQADVVLGMELTDYWGAVNAFIDNGDDGGPGLRESLVKPGTKLISINSVDLLTKANYQDFERYQAIDLAMHVQRMADRRDRVLSDGPLAPPYWIRTSTLRVSRSRWVYGPRGRSPARTTSDRR
jgi:hypothetical protein